MDFREALGYGGEIVRMGRFDFYDRATKAYAVVRTGELWRLSTTTST